MWYRSCDTVSSFFPQKIHVENSLHTVKGKFRKRLLIGYALFSAENKNAKIYHLKDNLTFNFSSLAKKLKCMPIHGKDFCFYNHHVQERQAHEFN